MLRPRVWQVLLILATIGLSWQLMMGLHELGHVLNAWLSGGSVQRVVWHPLTISRTDVFPNPHPQFLAWGGAGWGCLIPMLLLLVGGRFAPRYRFLLRFFAGFCFVANGLYLAAGAYSGIGDASDLVRHGAARWQLVSFGLPASVLGLWLWNGLGPSFGLGSERAQADKRLAISLTIVWLALAGFAAGLSSS